MKDLIINAAISFMLTTIVGTTAILFGKPLDNGYLQFLFLCGMIGALHVDVYRNACKGGAA